MKTTWTKRFLSSTRGRIVALLRRKSHTVNELADAVGLTDNAVRAHLSTLERDGLVEQSGVQPGFRKPNTAYRLTIEGEHLFAKAYSPLLSCLLEVLRQRLEPDVLKDIVAEVGKQMAAPHQHNIQNMDVHQRLQQAITLIEELGGLVELEAAAERHFLRGSGCPFAAVATDYPQVCNLTAVFLANIIGAPVQVCCEREGSPRCCFEVSLTAPAP